MGRVGPVYDGSGGVQIFLSRVKILLIGSAHTQFRTKLYFEYGTFIIDKTCSKTVDKLINNGQ